MAPLAYALIASAIPQIVVSQTLHMPLSSRTKLRPALSKRDGTYGASLQNYIPGAEYFATIEVGTPPQTLELIVDTGSSDLWMFAPGACRSSRQTGPCIGGTYDSSASSTYSLIYANEFQIQYADGSGVKGDYIQDDVTIAGATLKGQTMAVATEDTSNTAGIMGIGLDTRESSAEFGKTYDNVPDNFKNQGLIGTEAFSLYLDSLSSPSGSLLWGGYDTDKFTGDIVMLPLLTDSETGVIDGFTIPWTTMTVTNSDGTFAVAGGNFPYAVTLDSGSTLATLPTDIYQSLAESFNVDDSQGDALVSCDLGTTDGYVTFGFGGDGGPIIAVPFSELAVPSYNPNNGEWQEDSNGQKVCVFGFQDATAVASGQVLFGQSVLRSAYLLYDLENKYLGIAATVYNSNSSNVIEYNGKSSTQSITFVANEPQPTAGSMASVGQGDGFGSFTGGPVATGSATGLSGASGVSFVATTATNSAPTLGAQTFQQSIATLSAQTAAVTGSGSGSGSSGGHNAASSVSSRVAGLSALMITLGFLGGSILL